MKKLILSMNGVAVLSKNQQKVILGGAPVPPDSCVGKRTGDSCGTNSICCLGSCISKDRAACQDM